MDQNSIHGHCGCPVEMWSLKVTSCFPLSVFLSHRAPGSCHKKPERQSAITYDYSEEELMASIEREYC